MLIILLFNEVILDFSTFTWFQLKLHMTCLYAKKKVNDNIIGLINDTKEYIENSDESIFDE